MFDRPDSDAPVPVEAQPLPENASSHNLDHGQVGIGTLIVFIAMVLVAAIAAGVLINTAGVLQSESAETGEQSSQQATDRLQPVTKLGLVGNSEDTDAGNEVEYIEIDVKRSPGAGNINLSRATIHFIGPKGSADLTETDRMVTGAENFETSGVKGSAPTLANDSDVITIRIQLDYDGDAVDVLQPGDTAILKIALETGGITTVKLAVPDTLSGENAVGL
ncbi:MAG: archaellin/type IV pilin N-terminal domain-containing protein [Salinirussus sp.]